MRVRIGLVVVAWGLCNIGGPAWAATRLALWSDAASRDEAGLLAAELSARSAASGYELIERDAMARLVAEQGRAGQEASVALKAGRLLGAAGVVWLERVELGGRPRRVLRLSAVESGLVAAWRLEGVSPVDTAEWAGKTARRLEEWRPRLAVSRAEAKAVTVLNLRRSGASARGADLAREQALTLVLGEALANAPRLRVLERSRLEDLALEAVLGGEARDAFWQGAAIVDGSFTEAAGETALTMRLRTAGGAEARWTVRGDDAGKVVAEAAAEATRRLLGDSFAGRWDRAAEAREFLDEARWAARWDLHARVAEAAEAAIVLGGETPELRRLRYLARARLVWGGRELVLHPDGEVPLQMTPAGLRLAAPPVERIEAARHVLALFADHRGRPESRAEDERPAGPPRMMPMAGGRMDMLHSTRAEMDAVELLGGAARVLRDGYLATNLDGPTRETLAELRRAARETFEREAAARAGSGSPRAPGAGLPALPQPGPFFETNETLRVVGYAHGALWAERLADHQAWVEAVFAAESEPGGFDQLLRLTTSRRVGAWEVDWGTRDGAAARALWAAKAREWLGSADAGLRVAGVFQLLALNAPFGVPPGGGFGAGEEAPPEWARFGSRAEREACVTEALRALAAVLDNPAEGADRAGYVEAARRALNGQVPEAAREDWARVQASAQGGPRARGNPANAAPAHSQAAGPRARQAKIPMWGFWIAPEARLPAADSSDHGPRRGIRWAEREAGRVRVITEEAENHGRGRRFTLTEIEVPGLRERRLGRWSPSEVHDGNPYPDFPRFAFLGGWVFAWEGGGLWRHAPDGAASSRIELPVGGPARLWALDGRIYVAPEKGGIVRVDPRSGAWEMLADSRRRPAEGPLDDRREYKVQRMWTGVDGAVRVCATTRGEQIFRRDEARRTWVLEADQPHANLPGHAYQRAECVAWLEEMPLAAPGHGKAELGRLLRDVARAGDWRVPAGFGFGSHYGDGANLAPLGGLTRAGDVWAVLHATEMPRRSPRLVWMPAPETGRDIVCAELEIPEELLRRISAKPDDLAYGGIGGEHARLLPGPEGLVIYSVGSPVLWFVSKARLESAGMVWAE